MEKKKGRFEFQKMKQSNRKVVWVTAYDYWTAQFAEKVGVDMIWWAIRWACVFTGMKVPSR